MLEREPLIDSVEKALAIANAVTSSKVQQDVVARFRQGVLAAPELISVFVDEPQARFLGRPPGNYEVWLVMKDDPQSVFYDPVSRLFGACWGPDIVTGRFVDLAVRSANPLEMYLA